MVIQEKKDVISVQFEVESRQEPFTISATAEKVLGSPNLVEIDFSISHPDSRYSVSVETAMVKIDFTENALVDYAFQRITASGETMAEKYYKTLKTLQTA